MGEKRDKRDESFRFGCHGVDEDSNGMLELRRMCICDSTIRTYGGNAFLLSLL